MDSIKKTYSVLIIGAGNIAAGYDAPDSKEILTHVHALKQMDMFEILGIYDVICEKADLAGEKWGIPVVRNLDDVRSSADIVVCAVPDKYHYDVLEELECWSKLKAIICEKPLTESAKSSKHIFNDYKSTDIIVAVNYTRRYLTEFQDLKMWIKTEAGNLITGSCMYGKGLVHNGSHFLNLLLYLFDNIKSLWGGKTISDYFIDDPSVEFALDINAATIVFQAIPCNYATSFEMDLCFTKGRVKYDDSLGTIEYYNIAESEEYSGEMNYKLSKTINIDRSGALLNLYSNIFEVLKENAHIVSSMEDAVKTMCLCEEIQRMAIKEKVD